MSYKSLRDNVYNRVSNTSKHLQSRANEWKKSMIQRKMNYVLAVMVNREGKASDYPVYSYILHLIMAAFSEFTVRVILSFVFVLALAGVQAGVINFTIASLAKGFAFGGAVMILGKVSSYSRFENVFASWWPSSSRMFSTKSIQPYADLVHVVVYAIAQYAGSLLGLGIAMWVSNASVVGSGNPAAFVISFGVLGTHTITTENIWIIEIIGSTILTFSWLMLVVHREGVKNNIYAGLGLGLIFTGLCGILLPATGANFDVIHYIALRTVMSNKEADIGRHGTAYIFAPIIGAILAWVGYIIIASFCYAGNYERPGMVEHDTKKPRQKKTRSTIRDDNLDLDRDLNDELNADLDPNENANSRYRGVKTRSSRRRTYH